MNKAKRFRPEFFNKDYFENGINSLYGFANISPYSDETYLPQARDLAKKLSQHLHEGDFFLEIGCAKGFMTGALRELGFNGVGIDISRYATRHSRKKDRGVLVCGDIIDMPFKDQVFTTAWASNILEHIPIEFLERALEGIKRILTPNALLFVLVPLHGLEEELDGSHVSVLTKEEWLTLFRKYFQIENVLEYEPNNLEEFILRNV